MTTSNYKPSYVWPNPAFPFRIYFESETLRIFIIENIQHNWEWLSKYHNKFRKSDYFFVYCGWYHSPYFAKQAEMIFSELKLKKENFFFLFNSKIEKDNFEAEGFKGEIINQNAWLDENLVMRVIPDEKKLYDAIYIARFSAFKRHELAEKVENLALVAGNNHGNPINQKIPSHIYKNDAPLTPDQVCEKINQSRCGLILSAEEGACFSSSEYLLCGIPVVSTHSVGGRDAWYDDYNSRVVEPDPAKIRDAVSYFLDNPRDPYKIRNDHITKAQVYRNKFIDRLGSLFYQHGIQQDARQYFINTFFHKLRKSYKPDFDEIFK